MSVLRRMCRSPIAQGLLSFAPTCGLLLAVAPGARAATPASVPGAQGVLEVASAHGFDATVARAKAAVAAKGVRFFDAIDQTALAESANIPLKRSTLLIFGNPPLGVQFLTANRLAGLDWPVRMLVSEDADGTVRVAWTDFAWIAARYGLKDRDAQLAMARDVAAGIASAAAD